MKEKKSCYWKILNSHNGDRDGKQAENDTPKTIFA